MIKKTLQIRFKGFTDDWLERKFGDLVDSYNEIVPGNSNYPIATSSRRGLFLQKDYFDGARSGIDKNVSFRKVPENYVTYRHMSDDSIFKFNQNSFDTPVLVSKEYPVFRANRQANQKFLLDHLNNSPEFFKFSTLQKLGGTRVRLYFKNLQAYKLMMPNIEEQNAIASFFTNLDKLIAANQRKLDLLKEQKKGFLQKMFPKNGEKVPELRFAGFTDDWEDRKLKDVVEKQIKGKAQFEKLAPGAVEYLDTSRLNGGEAILTNGLKDVTLDDILILWDGSKAGTVYHGFEGALGSTLKAYRTSANSKFVYQYLKRHQDNIYNNYRTPNIPHVQKDFLDVFTISVSKSDEQAKIGSFFKQLDDTIALHQRKLDLLKEQKKGFLQKMFL